MEQEAQLDIQRFFKADVPQEHEVGSVVEVEVKSEPLEPLDLSTNLNEEYVRTLEMYCLLKQRLLNIRHNWKEVVKEALFDHGKHTGMVQLRLNGWPLWKAV